MKLVLESLLVEMKIVFVDRVPRYFENGVNNEGVKFVPISGLAQLGSQFRNRYDGVVNSVLEKIQDQALRQAVLAAIEKDKEYGYAGFVLRIDNVLLELIGMTIGNIANQEGYFKYLRAEDSVKRKEHLLGLKRKLAGLVKEYTWVDEEPVSQSALPAVAPSADVVARLKQDADIAKLKGTITAARVVNAVAPRGAASKTIADINSAEGLIEVIRFYLSMHPNDVSKIVRNLDFVVNYTAKNKPSLKGVSYREEMQATLR